jgi:hypothetical protein
VQLKGAHFLRAQLFRRPAKILGELLNSVKVTTDGVGGVMTALELVQQALT